MAKASWPFVDVRLCAVGSLLGWAWKIGLRQVDGVPSSQYIILQTVHMSRPFVIVYSWNSRNGDDITGSTVCRSEEHDPDRVSGGRRNAANRARTSRRHGFDFRGHIGGGLPRYFSFLTLLLRSDMFFYTFPHIFICVVIFYICNHTRYQREFLSNRHPDP